MPHRPRPDAARRGPVFWGCGTTPQNALLQAKPEIIVTHKPGCLLITDVPPHADAMDGQRLVA